MLNFILFFARFHLSLIHANAIFHTCGHTCLLDVSVAHSHQALRLDAGNLKAQYRMAQALAGMSDFAEAKRVCAAAVRADPSNAADFRRLHADIVRIDAERTAAQRAFEQTMGRRMQEKMAMGSSGTGTGSGTDSSTGSVSHADTDTGTSTNSGAGTGAGAVSLTAEDAVALATSATPAVTAQEARP